MTLAQVIVLALQSSITVLVFTIGLGATPAELTYLLRHPGRLVRSLVSMDLVMLVLAVAIVLLFPLKPVVKLMLVALALSPVPPVLPKKLVKAGGGKAYVMALLFTASLFAIVWTPLAGVILDPIFPADIHIPLVAVAKVVSLTVLGPTAAGVVLRLIAPRLAERVAPVLGNVAALILLVGLGLLLVKAAPAMLALLGDGTLLAIVLFLVVGLLAGHLLGGPAPSDRSVLALATASRHPGLALAIAQLNFPAEKSMLAALLLYLLVGLIVTAPYVRWRRKVLVEETPVAATPAR
jgi:BASS family bile acid:Na+ symporter